MSPQSLQSSEKRRVMIWRETELRERLASGFCFVPFATESSLKLWALSDAYSELVGSLLDSKTFKVIHRVRPWSSEVGPPLATAQGEALIDVDR